MLYNFEKRCWEDVLEEWFSERKNNWKALAGTCVQNSFYAASEKIISFSIYKNEELRNLEGLSYKIWSTLPFPYGKRDPGWIVFSTNSTSFCMQRRQLHIPCELAWYTKGIGPSKPAIGFWQLLRAPDNSIDSCWVYCSLGDRRSKLVKEILQAAVGPCATRNFYRNSI